MESVQFAKAKNEAVAKSIRSDLFKQADSPLTDQGRREKLGGNLNPPPTTTEIIHDFAPSKPPEPSFVSVDTKFRRLNDDVSHLKKSRINSDQKLDAGLLMREIFGNEKLYKAMMDNYFGHYTERLALMNTVQHIRIAYCIFGGFQFAVSLMTVVISARLIQVQ